MKNVQDILPLSGMQQGILFHVLAEPDSALYVEQAAWIVEGDFRPSLFQSAWERVIARHATLRTCIFTEKLDRPLQVVRGEIALPLEQQDWRAIPESEQQARVAALIEEHRRSPFNLARAPLFRLIAIRLAERVWRIVWTWHHLILDGWSVSLVLGEIFAVYSALYHGRELELPRCRSFRDYAAFVQSNDTTRAEQFWRTALQGFEPETESGNAVGIGSAYRSTSFALCSASTARLREFTRYHRITANVALQAAWAAVLSAESGKPRLAFGSVVSGRSADFDGLGSIPGLFLNTLPVCVHVNPAEPMSSFLELLQRNDLEARAFEYISLPQIKRWSGLPADRRLFDSLVVFDNLPAVDYTAVNEAGISVREFVHSTAHTGYPITLEVFPGEQLQLQITCDTARFSQAAAERLAAHLETALVNLSSGPARVEGIGSLTPAERHQIVDEWNDTCAFVGEDSLLHQWIRRQALKTPDAIALIFGETRITYCDLDRRSDRLAAHLTAMGAGPEARVGICAERSADLVIWLVAILKSGASYVPLDATYPAQRVRFMAESARARLIVTERRFLPLLRAEARFVLMNDSFEGGEYRPFVPPAMHGDNAAYAIFTSGSTGAPKAAVNTHAAIVNRLVWMQRRYELTSGDRVLQKTPMSFDVSVWEFFWPLIAGATLVIAAPGGHRDPAYLRELIVRERITTVHFVPAMLQAFLEEPAVETCSSLRLVLASGEALTPELRVRFFERLSARLHNLYGPTEAAVDVTHWDCSASTPSDSVPIGKPIANVATRILDAALRAVPVGVPGQLAIGGVALARGYLDRPDLTAASFIPDPYAAHPGARLYLTGDRARYLPSGDIQFLGRLDEQVKLRGFRIEPAEIEAAIRRHPAVAHAVVLRRESNGGVQLVAWYLPGGECSPDELKKFVAAALPEYMVPASFVRVKVWPLSPNGKLDRSALPAPEFHASESLAPTPPRTDAERALAQIWSKILGVPNPGVHDDFFESGGDSILAMLLSSKAREAGLNLTVREVFSTRTIAALAATASALSATQVSAAPFVEAPLTPIQRWFFDHVRTGASHFNQAVVLEVGDVEPTLLRHALDAAVARRDVFSLRFHQQDAAQWTQSRGTPPAGFFSWIDLASAPESACSTAFDAAAACLQASLDIETGPLLRAALFTYGGSRPTHLLVIAHHLAIDGVSWRLLLQDCDCAIEQIRSGLPLALPATGPQFLEWAAEVSSPANLRAAQTQAGLWLDLARRGSPSIPVDFQHGPNSAVSARRVTFSLSSAETHAILSGVSRAFHARIDEALISVFATVLAQWTESEEVRIAVESHGRAPLAGGIEVGQSVGWFTSMFPVPVRVAPSASLAETLRSVSDTFGAIRDSGIAYGLLRYGGDPERRNQFAAIPDPQVLFNYLGQFPQAESWLRPTTLDAGPLRHPEGERTHLFEINCGVAADSFHCVWEFSENLHLAATVRRLAQSFRAGLERLAAECEVSLGRRLAEADAALEDRYHLSPIQEGLVFHSLQSPESDAYFEQHVFTLEGEFSPRAFHRAWQFVIDRHTALRTSFEWHGIDKPIQRVSATAALPFAEADWRDLPAAEHSRHLGSLLEADRRKAFDLEKAPLLRLALVQTGNRRWICVWTWHHLLLDGWSLLIAMREVLLAYRSLLADRRPELPPAPRYRDYISWLDRQDPAPAQEFWTARLAGFESATTLPGESGRPAENAQAADACERIVLSEVEAEKLSRFARTRRVTLNVVAQAAWACLLARWSGRNDICFGAAISCRPSDLQGSSDMIGLLLNTVPVRTRLVPEERVGEWLDRMQEEIAGITPFAATPLSSIQSWTTVPRGAPLFESVLVYQNFPREPLRPDELGGLKIEGAEPQEKSAWPLMLVIEPAREIRLRLLYDPRRFLRTTAVKILEQFAALLNGIQQNPSAVTGSISPQTPAERHQLMIEWNDTVAPYDRTLCYHHLFEAQVLRSPSALAVESSDERLSYAELNARANRIARLLRAFGAGPERIVGVCLDRCSDLVAARLAVMKAGAAYLPLDPALPHERLVFMAADAAAVAVVTHSHLLDRLSGSNAPRIVLDSSQAEIGRESAADLKIPILPENLAYVIYTSGSTGRPKGVATAHAGFVNLVTWHNLAYRVTPADRKSQLSGLGFDASVWEMWPYLAAGASVHLPDEDTRANWPKLLEWMHAQRITLCFFPTPLAEAVVEQPWPPGFALRGLLTGGDRLHQWPRQKLKFAFVNKYGPTEVTAVTTWAPLLPNSENRSDPPSIGRPIANLRLYIMNANLEPVPTSAVGELFIGGVGLARCYHGRPDLTAEKFIPDPFSAEPGARLYRSGDLVRWSTQGEIEFLGRIDNQVKIRGFRVELGEIEAAIQAGEGVRGATVLAHSDSRGTPQLIAYIVPADPSAFSTAALVASLEAILPAYMIPSQWIVLDEFPLTPNGKVDHRALPRPQLDAGTESCSVPPRTELERSLASIWMETMSLTQLGIHDNFFSVGGDSIVSIRVSAAAIRHGFDINPGKIFEFPTIAELAAHLESTASVVGLAPQPGQNKPAGPNRRDLAVLARSLARRS